MKIYLAGKCNNRCLFCTIYNAQETPYNLIMEQMEGFDSYRDNRIVFTGSEPTVRQDIFDLLISAKKARAEIIQLNTNGRMFSNLKFTQKIIASGANFFKVSLHGDSPELHDYITQVRGCFKETISGIRNLTRLGQKEAIVISTVVNSLNYSHLYKILQVVKKLQVKKIQLNIVRTQISQLLGSLDEIAKRITSLRDQYLFDIFIKAKGLPYCLIPAPESLFLNDRDNKQEYVLLDKCKSCKYRAICPGILKCYIDNNMPDIKTIHDLPAEVMIEVESKCNFNCAFCFNRVSFASRGFGAQNMETGYVKAVIDNIQKANVSSVRFTGGEPMLREDFFELIAYAKSKGLEVRLNTNGSLISSYSMVKEIVKSLDYVLFAMHAYNSDKDERITGVKGSFEKKVRAMKWFKEAGIKILRVNTIASLDNINNLEKFYKLFRKLRVDRWAVNRLIPISKKTGFWGKKEALLLIKKLITIKKYNIRKKVPMWIHIVNAIPFCVDNPIHVSAISSGGRAVDGHERFAIDPRKFAKPIYYMDENIGDPMDIIGCWQHPFMRSMRNYEMLPDECRKCFFLDRCKGGNRFCAWIEGRNYYAADPLMNVANIQEYIW